MTDRELCFAPAVELAAAIARRDVSVPEVVEAHLDRIERCDGEIGAYVWTAPEQALAEARARQREIMRGELRGPLHGLPVAIKDLEDVAGMPTEAGSRTMAGNVAAEDAIFTARLRAAGAVVLGKTNTPEFGHKGTTDNLVAGPTSSPFQPGTNAGGSSGGSAAAVAHGMAALGQGGDGGGSIRIPAALCGVYGIKPSWGRIPHVYRPGGFLFTPCVSHGPLTRTVADAAAMLAAMTGPDRRDPLSLPDDGLDPLAACERPIDGMRVGFSPDLGLFPVDPRVAEVVERAVEAFTTAGATVEPIELRFDYTHQELAALWKRQIAVQHAQMVETMAREGRDPRALGDAGLEPELWRYLELAAELSAVGYKLDDVIRTHVFDVLGDALDRYDVLVSPTLTVPCVANADDGTTVGPDRVDGVEIDPIIGWCMTYLTNFTGQPAASVPAGLTAEGHPVGLQICGPRLRDDLVLAASAAFERVQPWQATYPGSRDGGEVALS